MKEGRGVGGREQVMPFLSPFLGPNKPGAILLRNKWYSRREVAKVARKPVLLLTSGLVGAASPASPCSASFAVKYRWLTAKDQEQGHAPAHS